MWSKILPVKYLKKACFRIDQMSLSTLRLYIDIYLYFKIFLNAPLAPIYTNFEGGVRAEKTQFLVEIFQKSA